jgi:hypothetical protein
VPVGMVRIRSVGMSVRKRTMFVPMCVRFSCRIGWLVIVLVVLVMDMRVRMPHRKMHMSMLMVLCKMQPNT